MAAPLVVQRGPAGALVIETAARHRADRGRPRAARAVLLAGRGRRRNTHELERLRSGALAALGRMATAGRARAEESAGRAAPLRAPPRAAAGKNGDADGAGLARRSRPPSITWPASCRRSPRSAVRPSCTACPPALHALLDECLAFAQAKCETPGVEVSGLRRGLSPTRCSTPASCARRS